MRPVLVVQALTVPVLVAVAFAAYRQHRRDAGMPSHLVFLSFSVLAVVSVGVTLFAGETTAMTVARRISLAVLPLFAYLMFRFAAAVTPSSRWFQRLAAVLTAGAVGSTLVVAVTAVPDRPAWNVLTMLLQWSLLSLAAATKLWQAGRREPAIARRRIRTLSVALVGLTITLVLARVPETATLELIVRLLALASAVLFLVAFAPPAALRSAWRRREEHHVQAAIVELMAAQSGEHVNKVLLPNVAHLLGGRGAALVKADDRVVASHGPVDTAGPCVEIADLSSGRLVVYLSPFTPLFGRDELDVVRSLAALAEVAVERGREHRVAEMLQRSLLPTEFPPLPGVRIEARYLPGGGIAVGGDWYDVIALADGRIGLAIGDVQGHGIRSAILMGQLRNSLRAYAIDGDPPATVLARLDALMRHLDRDELVTVLYGIIDTATLTFRLATAGHLTPIIAAPGRAAVMVASPAGPPLGTWSQRPPESSMSLPPGATIALFTDGLVERRHESISDGLTRLLESLGHDADASAADRVVNDLLSSVERDDDAALLMLTLPTAAGRGQTMSRAEALTELTPDLTSAAEARSFVLGVLELWGISDRDAVVLITSELVTNVVVHARTALSLSLRLCDRCIRVAVTDDGGGPVHRPRGEATDEHGRGLLLVEAMSSAWGVEPLPGGGKVVWCELRMP